MKRLEVHISGYTARELSKKTWTDFERLVQKEGLEIVAPIGKDNVVMRRTI